MSTWKPDWSGWRARVGLLRHDDSTVQESEFWYALRLAEVFKKSGTKERK